MAGAGTSLSLPDIDPRLGVLWIIILNFTETKIKILMLSTDAPSQGSISGKSYVPQRYKDLNST
jgi:hypothetical protein